MAQPAPRPHVYTLRRAASVVFALTAGVPLILFGYTLYTMGALRKGQAQIVLVLAVAASLVGFCILLIMMDRISGIFRAVRLPAEPAAAETSLRFDLPGIGTIREPHHVSDGVIPEVVEELRTMWKAEARAHVALRVLVSVRNAPHPIAGTLVEVSDDGLLLEQDDERVAISYRRISAIEAERPVRR